MSLEKRLREISAKLTTSQPEKAICPQYDCKQYGMYQHCYFDKYIDCPIFDPDKQKDIYSS